MSRDKASISSSSVEGEVESHGITTRVRMRIVDGAGFITDAFKHDYRTDLVTGGKVVADIANEFRRRQLTYSALLLAFSTVPAFAGDGGGTDGVGALLIQAIGRAIAKLTGMF